MSEPRRWTLRGSNYAQRNLCDGPDVPFRESVEVMLVSEHEEAMREWAEALDVVATERELAEAELEDLRAVEKAAREYFEATRATEYAWTDRMDAAFAALRVALDPPPSEPTELTPDSTRPGPPKPPPPDPGQDPATPPPPSPESS